MSTLIRPTETTPNVAHVQTGGSDTTGAIGNPALPFATLQGAVDAGATVIRMCVLSSALDLTGLSGNLTLHISGEGLGASIISTLIVPSSLVLTLRLDNVYAVDCYGVGGNGVVDGESGGNGAIVVIVGGKVGSFNLSGGDGAFSESGPGGPAGYGGTLLIIDSILSGNLVANGGKGGNSTSAPGVNGGQGGEISLTNCFDDTGLLGGTSNVEVSAVGGLGGNGEAGGGGTVGGAGGNGGAVLLISSRVFSVDCSGGDGGSGGGGTGAAGSTGTVDIELAIINSGSTPTPTGPGYVTGDWQAA